MKKFLSTLMAIFVSFQLLGITSGAEVATGGSDDDAVSTEIIEETEYGLVSIEYREEMSDDGTPVFSYEITNNSDRNISAMAIMCFYDEKGSIISSPEVQELDLRPNERTMEYMLSQDKQAYMAKIFVVDENYIPLCNSEELHIGNYSEDSGVYMYCQGNHDVGLGEIIFTFDEANNAVSFETPWSGAESTFVMLTRDDEYMYCDQIYEIGGFTGTLANLPDGEYTLWFFGSDGFVMTEHFACYYNGGSEGSQEDTKYVLDAINNAGSIREIMNLLDEYKDIIAADEEYYSLDTQGKERVCSELKGRNFADIEELRHAIYVAVDEYKEVEAPIPGGNGGGGGSGGIVVEGSNVVSVQTVKANAGETVCVDVLLNNNTGITSLGIDIDYDSSIMTLIDVCTTDATGAAVSTPRDFGVQPYSILFDGTVNFTYSGTLATLTFEVNADAPPGEYPIMVDYFKGPDRDYIDGVDINFDENLNPVAMTYADGAVVLYTPGDIYNDNRVNNKDATYLLRYLAGWEIEDLENIVVQALDTDGSGFVDEYDATHLLRYLVGWGNELH